MPETEHSQRKGELKIIHKKGGITDRTIARPISLYSNLLLGTPWASFKDVPAEMANYIKDRFKDVNWKGNIEIFLNDSPFFHQLKRLFSKDRRANFFIRATFGLTSTIGGTIGGKIFRNSGYNPYTETGQIYHPRKEIALQTVGKAEFFDQKAHEGRAGIVYSLPIFKTEREWTGARNAMKRLETDKEREDARKILEPAVGSYFGTGLGEIASFAGLHAGPKVGTHLPKVSLLSAFGHTINLLPTKFYPLAIPLFPAIGSLLGHIHARTSSENPFFAKEVRVSKEGKIENARTTGPADVVLPQASTPALAKAA